MSAVYFPRVIRDSGQAGVEPTTLEATEGAAGNISAFVRAAQPRRGLRPARRTYPTRARAGAHRGLGRRHGDGTSASRRQGGSRAERRRAARSRRQRAGDLRRGGRPPSDRRVEIAPRHPRRPGRAARPGLLRGGACPAASPDLPEPPPGLCEDRSAQRSPAALGTGDRRHVPRGDRAHPVPDAGLGRAAARNGGRAARPSSCHVAEARRGGAERRARRGRPTWWSTRRWRRATRCSTCGWGADGGPRTRISGPCARRSTSPYRPPLSRTAKPSPTPPPRSGAG